MLTVADLIRLLQSCEATAFVVLSADAEGNSYDTLHSVEAEHNLDPADVRTSKEGRQQLKAAGFVVLWP